MSLPSSDRRAFLRKNLGLLACMGVAGTVAGRSVSPHQLPDLPCAEEMRPGQITARLRQQSLAFIPVSPALEWHSLHLPLGTDALICEAICREMAVHTGGIWFRPLSLGLDSWRNAAEKAMWGLPQDQEVFGMSFPALSLESEYCQNQDLERLVQFRIEFARKAGASEILIVNHHGGLGQFALLEHLAATQTTDGCRVRSVKTYQFNDLTPEEGFHHTGGHAGYAETLWALAFVPALVALEELPDGPLSVAEFGILHDKPQIEAKWNPRRVSHETAAMLKTRVLQNFSAFLTR